VFAEGFLPETTSTVMHLLADIALLPSSKIDSTPLRPKARLLLSVLIDAYHAENPDTELAVAGTGILGHPSRVEMKLDAEKKAASRRLTLARALEVAKRDAVLKKEAEVERLALLKTQRQADKTLATKHHAEKDATRWLALLRMREGDAAKERRSLTHSKMHWPGWRLNKWPTDRMSAQARKEWLPEKLTNITLIWDDVRHLDDTTFGANFADKNVILADLLDKRKNITYCLLGYQCQNPAVALAVSSYKEWTWGAPYTISITSTAHTLEDDFGAMRSMHPVCIAAHKSGDHTFGSQQAVVYRLLRGPSSTDSSIRHHKTIAHVAAGTGAACWNAGRTTVLDHKKEDVPWLSALPKELSAEPYVHARSCL
jgi:hypothetical protein